MFSTQGGCHVSARYSSEQSAGGVGGGSGIGDGARDEARCRCSGGRTSVEPGGSDCDEPGSRVDAQIAGGGAERPGRGGRKKGAPSRRCSCGGAREHRGRYARSVITATGTVRVRRVNFVCRVCRVGAHPLDERLGIEGSTSWQARRLMC